MAAGSFMPGPGGRWCRDTGNRFPLHRPNGSNGILSGQMDEVVRATGIMVSCLVPGIISLLRVKTGVNAT